MRFHWRDDRYAHQVTLCGSTGEHRVVLDSVESDASHPWPPSPALQQLSLQGDGDQRIAFLVGMAGTSHWSMSVEAATAQRAIVFDVACRLNTAPEFLGSSYQASKHRLVNPRTVTGSCDEHGWALVLDESLPLASQSLHQTADALQVACHPLDSTPPYTARWKYAVTAGETANLGRVSNLSK